MSTLRPPSPLLPRARAVLRWFDFFSPLLVALCCLACFVLLSAVRHLVFSHAVVVTYIYAIYVDPSIVVVAAAAAIRTTCALLSLP